MTVQAGLGKILLLGLTLMASACWWPSEASNGPTAADVAQWPRIDCDRATTLHEFLDCVREHIPRTGELDAPGAFLPPDRGSRARLEALAFRLARASDPCAEPIPRTLPTLRLTRLDAPQGSFCILWEGRSHPNTGRAAQGLGTLILHLRPAVPLILGVPHPLSDLDTAEQGKGLLIGLRARALVLAGAHRRASTRASTCQGPTYRASDAAHNLGGYNSLLRGLVLAMDDRADTQLLLDGTDYLAPENIERQWHAIELHGMAPAKPGDSCFDAARGRSLTVYLSTGATALDSTGLSGRLLQALESAHPEWSVGYPGGPVPCDLAGTSNVLGRMLNGIESTGENTEGNPVCNLEVHQPIAAFDGRFLHIEQARCSDAASLPCGTPEQQVRNPENWLDPFHRALHRDPVQTRGAPSVTVHSKR